MTLRRKLLTLFGSLAVIALVVAGVTLWVTLRWDATSAQMEAHYERSLILQRVRAATFEATKEVSDAAFLGDADSKAEFEAAIAIAETDLQRWAGLADDVDEQVEVERVRESFSRLVADARRAFDLIRAGQRDVAARIVEERLEDAGDGAFKTVSEAGVERDRARREDVRGAVTTVRDTAYAILMIAALATLSLIFLLAAYLASDLFRPLLAVAAALDGLGRGERTGCLDENRSDEIGAIHAAFNRLATSLRTTGAPPGPQQAEGEQATDAPADGDVRAPGREMRTLIAHMRARLAPTSDGSVEDILLAMENLTERVSVSDLKPATVDVPALIYDVLSRFQGEMAERGAGCEVRLDPTLGSLRADRLLLHGALTEVVRTALAALPEHGGLLGIRTSRKTGEAGDRAVIDIADNRPDAPLPDIGSLARASPGHGRPTGTDLAADVARRHGGTVIVKRGESVGHNVRLELPLGAPADVRPGRRA